MLLVGGVAYAHVNLTHEVASVLVVGELGVKIAESAGHVHLHQE